MRLMSVRLGASVTIVAIALMTVSFGLSGATKPPSTKAGMYLGDANEDTNKSLLSASQMEPTNVSQLPVFPGSQQVEESKALSPSEEIVVYRTQENILRLRDFYGRELLKQGWLPQDKDQDLAVNDHSSTDDTNRRYQYMWPSLQRDLAYSAYVTVIFLVESPEQTLTRLILRRIPHLTAIPVYPGAKQIDVHYIKDLTVSPGFDIQVTTYKADAKIDDVETYIRKSLRDLGWKLDESHLHQISFRYADGGSDALHYGGGGTLSVQEETTTITRVEVQVHGMGIQAPK